MRELHRDAVCHLAHDGEDRALGRVAHRGVGAVGGACQRRADQRRVDQLARPAEQLLGGAADQLREDHAAVAARAQQRRARDRLDDLVAPDLVDRAVAAGGEAVELGEHRLHRQDHVVAGVAVGDGEDVEVVDLLAARLQMGERPGDEVAEADQVGVSHDPRLLSGLGDLAGFEAARADVDATGRAALDDPDLLQVRVEASAGGDHRVAAVVAERRALGA